MPVSFFGLLPGLTVESHKSQQRGFFQLSSELSRAPASRLAGFLPEGMSQMPAQPLIQPTEEHYSRACPAQRFGVGASQQCPTLPGGE